MMSLRSPGTPAGSSLQTSISNADAAIRASLKKRWLFLMPAVFVTYSLAYLDRTNFGFGVAGGLGQTLHITGKDTSLLSGLFFLGYFAFQVPGALFVKGRSVSKAVFYALLAWGLLAALTGVIHQFWLLALDRFLLGVAESLIFPLMLHLLTQWFNRAERSRANTFLMLGNTITVLWMSLITGFLIQKFGWQLTFILEGLPSMLWAVVWILLVRDRPSDTSWMTVEAAAQLEMQLTQEQIGVAPAGAVRQVLLRGDVLLLAAQYFCWSLGVYGFVLWLPTFVRRGAALSMANTGLLSALPYLLAIVLMLTVSYYSDKTQKRKVFVWPLLLLSGIALLGSYFLAQRAFSFSFLGLVIGGACMYAPYGPFFAIVPERVPREVTAVVLALINSAGALGGFFGSYFVGWLQAATGNSQAGYLLMALSLLSSAVLLLFLPRAPAAAALPAEVEA